MALSKGAAALLLALFLTLTVVSAAGPKAEKLTSQNPCANKASCGECIQTKTCAWCLQPQTNISDARCFQPSYDHTGSCPEEFTYNPDSQLTHLKNLELSRSKRMDMDMQADAAIAGEGSSASGYQQSAKSSYSSSYSSYSNSSGTHTSSSSTSWRREGEIVQIKPQRVNLKLRVSK